MKFFKERIEHQYPLIVGPEDPMLRQWEAHHAFMKNRCEGVLGREDIIQRVITLNVNHLRGHVQSFMSQAKVTIMSHWPFPTPTPIPK